MSFYVYMLISIEKKSVTYVGYTIDLKKRNLLAGIHNGTPEYAQKMLDKGFNLVTVGSDSRYIAAGAKKDLEKLKGNIKVSASKDY